MPRPRQPTFDELLAIMHADERAFWESGSGNSKQRDDFLESIKERWTELNKPVYKIPFPTPSKEYLRRERISQAYRSGQRPDPEDLAEEAADEIRYKQEVAAAFDRKAKELSTPRPPVPLESKKSPSSDKSTGISEDKILELPETTTPDAPVLPARKHWFDAIAEHPLFWGVLALIALAVSLSPKASAPLTILSLAAAWILVVRMVYMLEHVREKPMRSRVTITCIVAVVTLTLLVLFGSWLLTPAKPVSVEVASSPPLPLQAPAPGMQPQQSSSPDNRPRGFLQLGKIEILPQYSEITAGKQFGANFHGVNSSQERVFNAFGYTLGFVEDVDDQTDKRVKAKFENELRPFREQYLAGKIKGPEQGVGSSIWMTIATEPLTQYQVDGIEKGTTRIYFVTWLAWANSQGRQDSSYDCRWLQGHTLPAPYEQKDVVWHFCRD
jgi:heme/copper-type cytochrome/quinol oxidase subunit 4